ncbi:MAG: FlgD immunoglobulin-like domain containing protein [Candidatus Edwardsbacteria bacterium]
MDSLGWSVETVDTIGDAGFYKSSLKCDNSGYPHIAYVDAKNAYLKYGKWTGATWEIEIVDSTGGYCCLALDATDNPHIAYGDAFTEDLIYAKKTGGNWTFEIVDTVGSIWMAPSIVLDDNGYPHISYCEDYNDDLKYAKWTGSTWVVEAVDTAGKVGIYSSLALDKNGYPHITHNKFKTGTDSLKYARWTGSGWNIEVIDSIGDASYSRSSLVLDTLNYPHIAYHYYPTMDLKYATWTGTEWNIQFVDTVGDVGWEPSIVLDKDEFPHISYGAGTGFPAKDLKYAKMVPTGVEETSVHSSKFIVHSKLYQNYPNPFSSQTAIRYSLSAMSHEPSAISHTTLKIYNVAGQLVKTLVGQTFLSDITPGVHRVKWDGKDESGREVSGGVYFYCLRIGNQSMTRKMILLK